MFAEHFDPYTVNLLVGEGCSNQMQVAQEQVLVKVCALVQAAIGCCILLLPGHYPLVRILLVPMMVLALCNLRWWCFSYHQLSKNITDTHDGHHLRKHVWWC